MIGILNRLVAASFYLLFFLVPLIFFSDTSELFEYNKMMTVYALTVVIAGLWLIKMLVLKKFIYRRTFLEIPLLLYLGSHILSTVFSIDPHISFWGYYSRFHEGLLASASYIFLYFAAVSNLNSSQVKKIFYFSFASAVIVSIWGALEHFGYSPSCLIITGNFGVDCWIQDVKNRVFATLGQPNWMAAYLCVQILILLGFVRQFKILNFKFQIAAGLAALLSAALWFTKSRSGFLGLAAGLGALVILVAPVSHRVKVLLCAAALVIGSLAGVRWYQNLPAPGVGITESETIRKPVWEGAVKVWQRYPVFGSGVETFVYSFYKDRPASKNLDSEWDFLYNKAHNEYLNLLATTGMVGIIAYSGVILAFSVWIIYNLQFKIFKNSNISNSFQISNFKFQIIALFSAWVTILVTNFFGFSVVIIGLYFFLIPAFCYLLATANEDSPSQGQSGVKSLPSLGTGQIGAIGLVVLVMIILELRLLTMWRADKAYAYGKNLNGVGQSVLAYSYLAESLKLNPAEPTYDDEFAYTAAVLANTLFTQINSATDSAIASLSAQEKLTIKSPQLDASVNDLASQAISHSNKAVTTSPASLPFWKNRTKTFYQLASIDQKYYTHALESLRIAADLAPTDAKVSYNLGLLTGRLVSPAEGITILEKTVAMKPDYRDAYYALGQFYAESGDKTKARQQMEFILNKIGPDDQAQKWLEENK